MVAKHLNFDISWNCSTDYLSSSERTYKQEIIATPFIYRLKEENVFELALKWDLFIRILEKNKIILEYKANDKYQIKFEENESHLPKQMEEIVLESYKKFLNEFNYRKVQTLLTNVNMASVSVTRISASVLQCLR